MRACTWDDFADATGAAYMVTVGKDSVELTLETSVQSPSAGRAGGSFRLEFRGPSTPVLPQAIYPFQRGDEVMEIFIVPFSNDGEGTRYEAIFY